MRAEEHWSLTTVLFRIHPKGCHTVASRVFLGNIQRLKIVIVPLYLWTLYYLKAHRDKDITYLI
jgi:hypothetical protein